MKIRLDQRLTELQLVPSRSQAESYIKLGQVTVDGKTVTKPGFLVSEDSTVKLLVSEQYVSRAALKLSSVAKALKLDFGGKTVLDVGSSTGGFTEYALRHGAIKVFAVELGTDQMHPLLRTDPRIELHEKTDILAVQPAHKAKAGQVSVPQPDMVVADVSFISLRKLLPHIATLCSKQTELVMMVKPQFEAAESNLKHKGVIKNDRVRRDILKDFEAWAQQSFIIIDKADSEVSGSKGNKERFYLLRKT